MQSKRKIVTKELSLIDLGQLAINWCKKKTKEGVIIFNEVNVGGNQSLIRFATKKMDEFLPPFNSENVGWENRNYFYEINFRDGKREKMWIAIKNNGLEKATQKAKLIYEFSNKEFSASDRWWTAWGTFTVKREAILNQETMDKILDEQFEDLMHTENNFFNYLRKQNEK